MKNPRVLFICSNNAGVNYWRMYQFFRGMMQKGLNCALSGYDVKDKAVGTWQYQLQLNPKLLDTINSLFKNADITIMQYYHTPVALALQLMYQEEYGKKIICEIDDYIIDVPHYNPVVAQSGITAGHTLEKVVMEQIRASEAVVTSTDYLGSLYKRFNKKIYTMDNSIDFSNWNCKNTNKNNKKVRIGWIGGANHYDDLFVLKRIIPLLNKAYGNKIEFTIVCGIPDYLKKIKGINLIKKNVDIDKYSDFIASQGFDIGLAPLEINRFNMAKSNLRILEYGALSIPCVATKIEPYTKTIIDGETGLLCETDADWITNISKLIDNESLRKQMGNNINTLIHDKYDLSKITDKYIKVIRGI